MIQSQQPIVGSDKETVHPQRCQKQERGQGAAVRSFHIRLALPLLGRVRIRDCPVLPGAGLGHICCFGKILNNLSFILKSFLTWTTNYMLTLLMGDICYFEGRGLKPCWSQNTNVHVSHPETGCTGGSEANSCILQARKLWLLSLRRPQAEGSLWNTGWSSVPTRGLSSTLLIHLWNRSRQGLHQNLCRLNSVFVLVSSPGVAGIIGIIPHWGYTREAQILSGIGWGENGQRQRLYASLSFPSSASQSEIFQEF